MTIKLLTFFLMKKSTINGRQLYDHGKLNFHFIVKNEKKPKQRNNLRHIKIEKKLNEISS